MLIIVIAAILSLLGIGFLIWQHIVDVKTNNRDYTIWRSATGFSMVIIGVVAIIICFGIAMSADINSDVNFQNNVERREMLIYRLEHINESNCGNEFLYNDIRDFNENIRYHKEYCDNPWIGIYLNEKNATLDYIDYKIGE
jgi:MFS superfamily sulfate permease-like transporter